MNTNWSKQARLLLIALLLILSQAGVQPSPAHAAEVVCYVDVDAIGANDGTSWTDAYTNLQNALVQVDPYICGIIWVAEGEYKPASVSRTQYFNVPANVALYGGFDGTETVLGQRDWLNHVTILSGDIGTGGDDSDNSYHVITIIGSAVIDGFTVTGAKADGANPNNRGGGIYSVCTSGVNLTLANMTISGNQADSLNGEGYGAGMYSSGCTLTVTDSLFDGNTMFDSNTSKYGSGGGLYLGGTTATSTFMNVTFQNNSAGSGFGGGIYSTSPLTMTNVIFNNNSAGSGGDGGGLYTIGTPTTLTNVTFSYNSAVYGGGLYATKLTNIITSTFNNNSATIDGGGIYAKYPVLTDVNLINNTADGGGGGIYTYSSASPLLTRVTFTGNTAANGGGWYGYNTTGTLSNVIFDGNTASENGGGVYLTSSHYPSTTNPAISATTFMNNIAAGEGGGMYNADAIPALTNVTFYNNSTDKGGGMANYDQSNATLNFVTFTANVVEVEGSAMANYKGLYPSNPTVKNSIFWGNTVTGSSTLVQVYNDAQSQAAITYSVMQDPDYIGVGNRFTDPYLGTLDYYHEGFTKTVPILTGSSAINNGEPLTCSGVDQNGIPRPVGIKCDMGAFEAGYTISGHVGVASATISYTDGIAKTATSNADCSYTLAVSYGYTGTITPYKLGYSFDPTSKSYASSPVNSDLTGQDFTAHSVNTYTISGTLGTNGKSATITYTGGSTTANASTGNYSFTVNQGWGGTVTPSKTGYTFLPANRDYLDVNENKTNQDYITSSDATPTLVVDKIGLGTVTSSPTGINCGSTCSYAFTKNISVTLTANPASGYNFTSWSGACTGSGSCVVVMSSIKSVTATFTAIDYPPSVLSSARVDSNPTAKRYVKFTVTFSEPVTGVDLTDFTLTTTGITGATVTGVSGSGATRTVTVKTGSKDGTLRLNVIDDDTIIDASLKPLGGTGAANGNFTSGEMYTIDKSIELRYQGANDGWVLESTKSSGKGGTMNSTDSSFYLGDDAQDKQYRGILSFDTAILPDTAVITKLTLKIRTSGLTGTNPFTTHGNISVDIRKGPFGGNNALQLGDFQATASKSAAGVIKNTPVSSWYSVSFAGTVFTYLNRTGVTQFRLRFPKGDNGDKGADYLKFYSGDTSLAANRPDLYIEYYVP